jgi:peptide/nickel transport system permease protein
VLVFLLLVAMLAPWLAPYPPLKTNMSNTLAPISAAHWLGTDQYGRDVFSRILLGTQISLKVAFAVVALSLTVGTLIGALAGFAGGWVERITVVIIDILLAFPGFLLALALVAARGSSLESVILAVAIAFTPRVAAVMRSVVLTIKPRPFIEASRAIGMSETRVLLRHVIPNALPPVIVVATVSAATAILAEAGLSFLGLGVQPPTPTWGNIISDGNALITTNPWISLAAGLCIALAVIAFNLLGDGLRDTLDPQMRRQTGRGLL